MSKILTVSMLAGLAISIGAIDSHAQDAGFSNVYQCQSLINDSERLACYDKAVAGLQNIQKNDELVTLKRSDIEKAKKKSFGLSPSSTASTIDELVEKAAVIKAPKVETVKTAESKIVDESQDRKQVEETDDEVILTLRETEIFGRQKVRFFFTNGQVWDQVDSYQFREPRLRKGKVTTAEIRKAAFGSYLLQVDGKGRAIRVKRKR